MASCVVLEATPRCTVVVAMHMLASQLQLLSCCAPSAPPDPPASPLPPSYERDIKLAADIGSTSFRFSFEWPRIEPYPGVYDHETIRRWGQKRDWACAHARQYRAHRYCIRNA